MTRERNPSVTTLQKAYAVLDKYKIGRTFFIKTDQTDCQIAEPADSNDVEKEEEAAAEKAAPAYVAGSVEPAVPAVEVPAKPVVKVEDGVRKEPVVEPAVAATNDKVESVHVPEVSKPADIPAKSH